MIEARSKITKNTIHFNLSTFRQFADTNGGTGRIGLLEILPHHLIDGSEITQIGKENIELNDIAQITTGSSANFTEVIEHLADLHTDITFDQFHGFGGIRGICPDRYTVLLTLTAWE